MIPKFPIRQFRLERGFTFENPLRGPKFHGENLLVGGISQEFTDTSSFFLGRLAEYGHMGTNVWFDLEGAHAIYVMGKRRSGKTYTLGTIAEGLASSQWINKSVDKQAILVLDTMNIFTTMHHSIIDVYGKNSTEAGQQQQWGLSSEEFSVTLFYPKGTNPPSEGISCELAIRPSDLSAENWAALFGVDTYSDSIGQLIAELYDKVCLEGYTDNAGTFIGKKTDYSIQDFFDCIDNSQDIHRYQIQTIEAVRRRLRAIQRQSIFSDTGIGIQDLFKKGNISVVLLRDLDYNLRGLLIGILIKKIIEKRSISDGYERLAEIQLEKSHAHEAENPEEASIYKTKYEEYLRESNKGLPRGWILIDEAHNYIPARGIIASREPLRKYVNEGRNLGLSIVVATQQPSGLDPAIRRNADILVIHSMSMRDDIDTAHSMLNTYVPDTVTIGNERISSRTFEQIVRSLDLGYAIISNDRMSRLFPVKVRPRITIHGGKQY